VRLFFLALLLVNIAFFAWHDRLVGWLAPRAPERPAGASQEVAPTLVLLSERTPAEAAAGAAPQPSVAATPPGGATPQCLSAGWFMDSAVAEQARAAAADAGLDARVEQAEREVTAYYVLLLPERYAAADQANGKLEALRAKGVSDVAAVALGDRFAVSLGIYNRPKAMEKRRQELLAAGFTPEVRERRAKRTVYSLALGGLDQADRDRLAALKDRLGALEPQLEWQEAACQ
jgi:hypothetical protein